MEVDRDHEASLRSDQRRLPFGKTPSCGGQHNVGVMGYGAQCVKAATESAPARTKEVVFG
jgi:hypothetical protein